MLKLVAVLPMLIAQAVHGAEGPRAATTVCEPQPPVPARITGRVVSRGGTPRAGVRIQANVPETRDEYTTQSDREGRYALTGFDAGLRIELEFQDESQRLATGCSVVPQRNTPAMTVDVVLDQPHASDAGAPVGCQHLTGWDAGSWVAQGTLRRLSPEEQSVLFGASPSEPTPRLDLRATDIERSVMTSDGAVLSLTPEGAKALRTFTEANTGRITLTTIEGEPALRVAVQGTISSGIVKVPEEYLRGRRLCRILEAISRQK
jgi:hypothetical protein